LATRPGRCGPHSSSGIGAVVRPLACPRVSWLHLLPVGRMLSPWCSPVATTRQSSQHSGAADDETDQHDREAGAGNRHLVQSVGFLRPPEGRSPTGRSGLLGLCVQAPHRVLPGLQYMIAEHDPRRLLASPCRSGERAHEGSCRSGCARAEPSSVGRGTWPWGHPGVQEAPDAPRTRRPRLPGRWSAQSVADHGRVRHRRAAVLGRFTSQP